MFADWSCTVLVHNGVEIITYHRVQSISVTLLSLPLREFKQKNLLSTNHKYSLVSSYLVSVTQYNYGKISKVSDD